MSLINRVLPSLANDIGRAFSLLDEPLFNVARRFPASFPTLSDQQSFFRPSVDVLENDKNYVIEAEVPGMKKEDLSVEFLDDGTLIMKGKIEQGTAPSTEGMRTVDTDTSGIVSTGTKPTFWTSERVRGHFQRSFQFPGRIDPENVKASYKDGLLSIVVPKVEKSGKQITIE
ncbi:HSP20-like chaperone [Rhizophagus irregularis]|uniref:HSP20-like chaperone n=2 Tax=Rhizophagus irregularis TaxID=588596 RepID=A0A2I1G3Z0_9GLOM|nr:HSP20-like chaperone [Rhizophagus irregularis DAOM 181602=DAOM 197198]PKC16152.1 HSP20-like chaperone [Rhizophagus irregularis]RGB43994.1 HSP20-like chaperone [Rhizophagus diaphanus] [Rhizophagus sp. MUCL 43196]PKC75968.1 HSP20-like chaperone [Rhizophagus irregularis]PKK79566.1 HSP20-like chaperone [Rhizophagus irregularis]PKY16892.1 HSP20-like chaperone [Rhizophagus irregularis]|eukprot:XP_025172985.1 HSP20-like chaperone [Rhizophagus irregularis DAOM 181602=DAOM 197198]